MKILFFINDLRSGGKERRLVELIKGLSYQKDIEMGIVLTRDIIHYGDIFLTDIKIFYVKRKEGVRKDYRVFYKFYKIARSFKPDIIHVWGNLVAIYAIPTKVLLRIPLINNQITDAPLTVSNSILSHKLTFPFSDRIISNTYAGLVSYSAPKSKSLVIYNGFNFERIKKLEKKEIIRKRFDINTKYVVGMVASFSDKKDYYTYIKAANEVLNNFREVTFLCIGDGDSGIFKEMISKKDKNRILFLGKQSNVESLMNICDIGVLMSNVNNHGEGISNALMEFMALKKPVIANDNGGNSELIENSKSGFIIHKGTEELKEKILLLLKDSKKRKDFGYISEQIVRQKFSIDKMINSFLNEYNFLINELK